MQRYYLDTSALLVRFLSRATGHAWMQTICERTARNTLVLAEITEAELASALHQLVRGGALRKKVSDQSRGACWRQVGASEYRIMPITSVVVRRAADLCAVHALRGYDAVQLAAALAARDDARQADASLIAAGGSGLGDPVFLTEDNKLRTAALAEGFAVDRPLNHP